MSDFLQLLRSRWIRRPVWTLSAHSFPYQALRPNCRRMWRSLDRSPTPMGPASEESGLYISRSLDLRELKGATRMTSSNSPIETRPSLMQGTVRENSSRMGRVLENMPRLVLSGSFKRHQSLRLHAVDPGPDPYGPQLPGTDPPPYRGDGDTVSTSDFRAGQQFVFHRPHLLLHPSPMSPHRISSMTK